MADGSFSSGFKGCLGVGCAVVIVLVGLPVGCMMLTGGLLSVGNSARNQAQEATRQVDSKKAHELPHATADSHGPTQPATTAATAMTPSKPVPSAPRSEAKKVADRPKEVNRLTIENFSRIQDGMTYAQVKRIIGPASEETLSSSAGVGTEFATKLVMLTWKGSWGANGNVTFQDGRVIAKAQIGLPHGEATEDLPDEEAEAAKAKRQAQIQAAKEWEEASRKQREEEKKRLEADAAARWRTWTNADTGRTLEAQYRGIVDDKVRLRKKDGTDVLVPPEKLSDEDRQWIEDRQKRPKQTTRQRGDL